MLYSEIIAERGIAESSTGGTKAIETMKIKK
jgi:hypothetical protein